MNIKDEKDHWIFVLGGQTKDPSGESDVPNDIIARYIVSKGPDDGYTDDPDKQETHRWDQKFLSQPTQRNGIINYNDDYIISFGGDIMKSKKPHPQSKSVYLLPLKGGKYGLEALTWYELPELSRKGHYHAVYKNGGIRFIYLIMVKKKEKEKFMNIDEIHCE